MTRIAAAPKVDVSIAPKVKGPIRCHKCRLNCVDAAHYLNHKCEPAPAPECSPYPSLASLKARV